MVFASFSVFRAVYCLYVAMTNMKNTFCWWKNRTGPIFFLESPWNPRGNIYRMKFMFWMLMSFITCGGTLVLGGVIK
jgi:hypothetical protein